MEADLQRSEAKVDALKNPDHAAQMRYRRGDQGQIVSEERDEMPLTKAEGIERWHKEMQLRFLRGEDGDFDYAAVDDNEELDDQSTMEREKQDAWFDEEEPGWAQQDHAHNELTGQTGVQDF